MNEADVMNRCDEKRQKLGFEALSEVERVISLVSYSNFEIIQGSISAFYSNSAGDYAVETVWALEQIGATEAAGLIRTGNDLLSMTGAFPRDRADRQEALTRLHATHPDILAELTDGYYDKEAQVWSDVEDYMHDHADDLRATGIL
jgi:hypothetical protein